MRNIVICQDYIRTPSHYDKVLLFCHVADELALVKKYRVLFRQPVITPEVFKFPPKRHFLLGHKRRPGIYISIFILLIQNIGKSPFIIHIVPLCVQTP